MTPDRWEALIRQWGGPKSQDVFLALEAAYSEPHRHYHGTKHIADCLDELERAIEGLGG